MGLDMYLNGRVSGYRTYGDEQPSATRAMLDEAARAVGLPPSDNIDCIEISREVGYWRKANQIHQWFVTNVQEGKDDCGDYYVSREQLAELRTLCKRVIDGSAVAEGKVTNGYSFSQETGEVPILEDGEVITNPTLAEQLLPTASGFFFGGTEYDGYYLADLANTIEIIDRCLAMPEHIDFQYHSSW